MNRRSIVADRITRIETPDQTGLTMIYTCDENSFTVVHADPADVKLEITTRFTKREQALVVEVDAKAPYNHINDVFFYSNALISPFFNFT
jgi:hypothetical protein